MGFKFTLLGIETYKTPKKVNIYCEDGLNQAGSPHKISSVKDKEPKEHKMVKRKKSTSKKVLKQQLRFKKAVKRCHKITATPSKFGKCMSRELKK